MAITLTLESPALDEEALQELTRQLCAALRDEAETDATLVTTPSHESGSRGDLPVWGQIAIATLSSTVLSAFVGVLTAYVQRAKSLAIKFDANTNHVIEISATNLNEAELHQRLLQSLETKRRLEAKPQNVEP